MDQKAYFEMSEELRGRYNAQQKFVYDQLICNLNPRSWLDGYMAGRKSMRQEAMKAADDQWVKDPRISASDAIKKIEA